MHAFCTIPYTAAVAALGAGVLGSVAYLLALLGAAARRSRRRPAVPTPGVSGPRLAVVVPAHDEELVLAGTLESLAVQDYPAERFEVVVVADNCSDATAAIARSHGSTVLERVNRAERGKGYALAWAFPRLLGRPAPADAFVIVDADTWVAPDFLSRAAAGIVRAAAADPQGRAALQGRYGVLNTSAGWRAALMAAAFDLYNHVKPLGRDGRGLSVGLKGNGMVFSRALLAQARWRGDSVTEDIDFGLDLVRDHGVRVGYLPEALVLAQMPATAAQAASQRERWEGGRYRLLRRRALPLLVDGLRRRDWALCDAAFDLALPPLAELAALLLLWGVLVAAGGALRLLPGAGAWGAAVASAAIGLAGYVLGGLAVSGAPRAAYLALARAPFYAVWKFVLYFRRAGGGGRPAGSAAETPWVRTARLPTGPPPAASSPAAERTGT